MNHLSALDRLGNRYYAMRHGHSLANQRGIIVSYPENGCAGYGLSEQGRAQVEASLEDDGDLDAATLIVCSDFRRAVESATIVRRLLGEGPAPEIDTRLRERNFGQLELGPDSAYEAIWQQDALDPNHVYRHAESPNRVMARVTELIVELERRHRGATLLLVSHGDALQILQTAFARRNASEHRQMPHLHTGEIRLLNPAPIWS